MKAVLALLLMASLACHSHALKCHTCVAANEEDCNEQGSATCPEYASACSTITGSNTVMKSCSYKAFCERAQGSNTGSKVECCFTDDCNGPHQSHRHGGRNAAGALGSSPALLLGALVLRTALSRI